MKLARRTDYFGERRLTPRRLFRKGRLLVGGTLLEATLRVRNLVAKSSVLGESTVIVSITSHGARLASVSTVIEGIARGKVRPRRMILWVDPGVDVATLGAGLRRLQRRGLEIAHSPDRYGPHTKYFPLAIADYSSSNGSSLDIVTADDDILYPRDWLSSLTEASRDRATILCHRAHRLLVEQERIAPYRRWLRVTSSRPSVLNFATGVMGVLYPAEFFRYVAAVGDRFLTVSPRADDVWLHAMALRGGFQVRQLKAVAAEFPMLFGSQASSLVSDNAFDGGNDEQIAATYTADDLLVLKAAQSREGLTARG
ncbi:glycosyltransferase [Microbacterium hatanonis]|uniref:Glycosyltransferase n=1 Tax=Microbacterium hatanonis TaxID=404366 RepID=A0A5C8HZG1_9MICO|nr:glycosyltransferase [Microbacterium hatanonis]TXK10316.1 glycosyltransferase [Microbacterium hatanonis]